MTGRVMVRLTSSESSLNVYYFSGIHSDLLVKIEFLTQDNVEILNKCFIFAFVAEALHLPQFFRLLRENFFRITNIDKEIK